MHVNEQFEFIVSIHIIIPHEKFIVRNKLTICSWNTCIDYYMIFFLKKITKFTNLLKCIVS